MALTVPTFVLDTNIVLYLLGGHLKHPLPTGRYAVSVITELELLAYSGLTEPDSIRIQALLQDVTVIDLTARVKHHAVDLRKRLHMKLPDAIIAGTTLALSATLLTNDHGLLAVSELPTQALALRT